MYCHTYFKPNTQIHVCFIIFNAKCLKTSCTELKIGVSRQIRYKILTLNANCDILFCLRIDL